MQSQSNYQSLPIAPSLPGNKNTHDFSNFDKVRWSEENNGSIFIKRIPDWLNKEAISTMFDTQYNQIGEVNRVHIVDVSPEKGAGRMAFVHFKQWHGTVESNKFRDTIVQTDNYVKVITNPVNSGERYYLNITANRRPIPISPAATVYDNDQLSDMINTAASSISRLEQMVMSQNVRIIELEKALADKNRNPPMKASVRDSVLSMISRNDLIHKPSLPSEPPKMSRQITTEYLYDMTEKYRDMAQGVIDDIFSGEIVDPVIHAIVHDASKN